MSFVCPRCNKPALTLSGYRRKTAICYKCRQEVKKMTAHSDLEKNKDYIQV